MELRVIWGTSYFGCSDLGCFDFSCSDFGHALSKFLLSYSTFTTWELIQHTRKWNEIDQMERFFFLVHCSRMRARTDKPHCLSDSSLGGWYQPFYQKAHTAWFLGIGGQVRKGRLWGSRCWTFSFWFTTPPADLRTELICSGGSSRGGHHFNCCSFQALISVDVGIQHQMPPHHQMRTQLHSICPTLHSRDTGTHDNLQCVWKPITFFSLLPEPTKSKQSSRLKSTEGNSDLLFSFTNWIIFGCFHQQNTKLSLWRSPQHFTEDETRWTSSGQWRNRSLSAAPHHPRSLIASFHANPQQGTAVWTERTVCVWTFALFEKCIWCRCTVFLSWDTKYPQWVSKKAGCAKQGTVWKLKPVLFW